jgi:type I restriction-modification system DNA methylase subunit
MSQQNLSSFIWSVADLLRGDYKQSEYGRVILPFTVLRRLDCVLEPTKDSVLAELMWQKMRKSPGNKRKELSDDHIAEITRLFGEAKEVWVDENSNHVSGASVSGKALASGPSGNNKHEKPALRHKR